MFTNFHIHAHERARTCTHTHTHTHTHTPLYVYGTAIAMQCNAAILLRLPLISFQPHWVLPLLPPLYISVSLFPSENPHTPQYQCIYVLFSSAPQCPKLFQICCISTSNQQQTSCGMFKIPYSSFCPYNICLFSQNIFTNQLLCKLVLFFLLLST